MHAAARIISPCTHVLLVGLASQAADLWFVKQNSWVGQVSWDGWAICFVAAMACKHMPPARLARPDAAGSDAHASRVL